MSKKYHGYIYLIQNIQNNKVYIGKTTQEPIKYIEEHFINALRGDKLNRAFYNAIRKYGKHNFKIRILGEIVSRNIRNLNKKLNQTEIDVIFHFRSFGSDGKHYDKKYGYNMTKGGEGGNGAEVGKKRKGFSNVEFFGEEKGKEINSRCGVRGHKNKYKSNSKGKTYEEIYGKEKAKEIKKKQSISCKGLNKGEKNGMYGKSVWNKGLTKETDSRIGTAWNRNIEIDRHLNEILELRKKGISLKEIGKMFNCSKSTIKVRIKEINNKSN